MQLILVKDDGTVSVVDKHIYGVKENFKDRVTWSNGAMGGIKEKHLLVDDALDIKAGDVINLDDYLEEFKSQYKNEVNMNVGIACLKGFTSATTGWSYETESHDQKNFDRRLAMVRAFPNKYPTVGWKCADGVVRDHTPEEFESVVSELDDFITSKVNKGWEIKNQIKNAQTVNDLETINLNVE